MNEFSLWAIKMNSLTPFYKKKIISSSGYNLPLRHAVSFYTSLAKRLCSLRLISLESCDPVGPGFCFHSTSRAPRPAHGPAANIRLACFELSGSKHGGMCKQEVVSFKTFSCGLNQIAWHHSDSCERSAPMSPVFNQETWLSWLLCRRRACILTTGARLFFHCSFAMFQSSSV